MLTQTTVPTLLVWGRQDPMFPFTLGERAAARNPSITLHALDACGHVPPLEHRDEFDRAVLEFLERR